MKLTTTTWISVDGVMQGLGAAQEDRRGGFERGGWAMPLFGEESEAFLDQVYGRAEAFLFGRVTYEIFADSWGKWHNLDASPIAAALNTRPKYVASGTLESAEWKNTTVLSGDLATAIRDLKAGPDGELQVHGSGTLTRWLLANELVDELTLLVCPVIIGQGTRLFPDRGPDTALELTGSRTLRTGVTVQHYRPRGRPRYSTLSSADIHGA